MNGFIKLHRSLLGWGWYKDANTRSVFIHLLLTANWKTSEYFGEKVERGQAVFGLNALAEHLGLSVRQVRTALSHLKSTREITIQTTSRFSVATVVNYCKYQDVSLTGDTPDDAPDDIETASNRQSNDNIKEYKNERNINRTRTAGPEEPDGSRPGRGKGKPREEKPWYVGTCWDVPDWTHRGEAIPPET